MADGNTIASIFLSASIPDPKRDPKYFLNTDLLAIREAVCALVVTVAPKAKLVFGGHPAISPLIYVTSKQLGATDNIVIYQSEFFRNQIPPESLSFSRLVWTPAGKDRADSLGQMRNEMIGKYQFKAAVFIGGMEGIEDECSIFMKTHPNTPVFPIASTGAASQLLFNSKIGPTDASTRDKLQNEFAYTALFRNILTI
jgi:hypothetical protein